MSPFSSAKRCPGIAVGLALFVVVATAPVHSQTVTRESQPGLIRGQVAVPVDMLQDVSISVQVRLLLNEDPYLIGTDVDVATVECIVTLRGRVSDMSLRDYAARVAGAAYGVRRVDNQLAVWLQAR